MSQSVATSAPATRTDSLASSVAILLMLTVVQRVVGLVRSVLFCRWLDPDQLGQWDLVFGFLMLAAPLALLGIPGSFGRYLEHYRQQGYLRTFLRRTAICSGVMGVLAVVVMIAVPDGFSYLIFGSHDQHTLVMIVAGTLGAVIAFNFCVSLFTALRRYRMVSAMQFMNTVLFAMFAITFMELFPPRASSVVLAFGLACLLTAMFAAFRLRPLWRELPTETSHLPHRQLWAKLLPFAFWLWMMNWISNVFDIVDRFLIVHHSGLGEFAALDLVGQYHSARVVPVLFIGVAEMLAGLITPHLTADWEAGRRAAVSQRLNMIVKLFILALVTAGSVFLLLAPTLFATVFKHKFAGGLEILPITLMACVWASTNSVMNNYMWCAEKSHHLSLTYGAGLLLNIALNLLLLPRFGLYGVGIAYASSKALSLVLMWWITAKYDWQADRGLFLIAALPLLLPLGGVVTLVITAIVIAGLTPSIPCFSSHERTALGESILGIWQRVVGPRRSPA